MANLQAYKGIFNWCSLWNKVHSFKLDLKAIILLKLYIVDVIQQ